MKLVRHCPKQLVAVLALCAMSSPGAAQANVSTESLWGGAIQWETSSSLHAWTDPSHSATSSVLLNPAYKIAPGYSLSAVVIVAQELTGQRTTKVTRTEGTLRRAAIRLNPFLSLSPALTLTPPFAADRQRRESLIASFKLAPRLLYTLEQVGAGWLTGYYEVSGTRSLHDYSVSTTGRSNQAYSLAQVLKAVAALPKGFALDLTFVRASGWTYQGNATHKFEIAQELAYQATPSLTLAVGHSNAAGLLKANGLDSNLALFNTETSSVYGALTYEF